MGFKLVGIKYCFYTLEVVSLDRETHQYRSLSTLVNKGYCFCFEIINMVNIIFGLFSIYHDLKDDLITNLIKLSY